MKQSVTLITCDDCGTQATEMHELTVTVDGHELTGDVCCQGCAVRFAQRHLIAVIESPAQAELALRRVG
jgi:hypothetical protein